MTWRALLVWPVLQCVLACTPSSSVQPAAEEAIRFGAPATRWSTPSLFRARCLHSTTRVDGSRVLVVGGHDGTRYLATNELCDLAGGCVGVRAMEVPRGWHSATALGDGSVLVTGGWTALGTPPTESAELIPDRGNDPPFAGALVQRRAGHTATLLTNGEVLIVGGFDGSGISRSVERYSPQTRRFTETTPLQIGRADHAAVRLSDGRVLISGGWSADFTGTRDDSVIFDPATDRWSDGPTLDQPRARHSAALLRDGRVVLAGGYADEPLASVELIGIGDGAPRSYVPLSVPRLGHTMTVLDSGLILFAGGLRDGVAIADVEALDPVTERVIHLAPLAERRAYASSVTLDAYTTLVVGGLDGQENAIATSELVSAPRDERLRGGAVREQSAQPRPPCAGCSIQRVW